MIFSVRENCSQDFSEWYSTINNETLFFFNVLLREKFSTVSSRVLVKSEREVSSVKAGVRRSRGLGNLYESWMCREMIALDNFRVFPYYLLIPQKVKFSIRWCSLIITLLRVSFIWRNCSRRIEQFGSFSMSNRKSLVVVQVWLQGIVVVPNSSRR